MFLLKCDENERRMASSGGRQSFALNEKHQINTAFACANCIMLSEIVATLNEISTINSFAGMASYALCKYSWRKCGSARKCEIPQPVSA